MPTMELTDLVRRLTRRSTRALEKGLERCMKRKHYEIQSEHVLLGLLDDEGSDFMLLVRHYGLDIARLRFVTERALDDLRTGNPGNPSFAPRLRVWLEEASVESLQRRNFPRIRSATLFLLLVQDPEKYFAVPFGGLLAPVPLRELGSSLHRIASSSNEEVEAPPAKERPIVPEGSAPVLRREPAPARPPISPARVDLESLSVAPERQPAAPPIAPAPEAPPAAAPIDPDRAALEARIASLEGALSRAEQRIVTLAQAQTRADAAIADLTRMVSELLSAAIAGQAAPAPDGGEPAP
ncbi:MAG: Clp protease N-terminal domain-containing protein [Byssovorax sp.]